MSGAPPAPRPRPAPAAAPPSAPMDTSLTPLLAMKSRALLTLAILWKRILPLSGLGSLSPGCKRRGQESEVMRGSQRHCSQTLYLSPAKSP